MFSVVSTAISLGSALGLGFMQASRARHHERSREPHQAAANHTNPREQLQALHK